MQPTDQSGARGRGFAHVYVLCDLAVPNWFMASASRNNYSIQDSTPTRQYSHN